MVEQIRAMLGRAEIASSSRICLWLRAHQNHYFFTGQVQQNNKEKYTIKGNQKSNFIGW